MCLMGGKAFHITFFKLLYIFLYFPKLKFHPLISVDDFNQIAQHWNHEKESIKTEPFSGLSVYLCNLYFNYLLNAMGEICCGKC